jgi:ribosomal protein S24E
MEIEIDSKKNNALLNRTEVYFTIKHPGEKTPNREIIRADLAEKLNVKKEDVIVNEIHTTFGKQIVTGYAKVYPSLDKSKGIEREHILVRNKLMEAKKKEKKGEAKPAEGAKPQKEAPKEQAPKPEAPKKEVKP